MGFEYKTITELDESFKRLNEGLKDKHDVLNNDSLTQERKVQIHFLDETLKLVKASRMDAKDQAKMFTGAILLVKAAIADTYALSNPDKSYLHKSIPACIGVKKDNLVSDADLFEMLNKLMPVLAQNLFENPIRHDVINKNCSFSDHDIGMVISLFNKGTSLQKEYSDKLSKQALQAYFEVTNGKDEKKSSSYFGLFLGKGKGKEAAEEPAEASSSAAPTK